MRTVIKSEETRTEAYCLGIQHPVIEKLKQKGLLKNDGSHWKVFSQESTDGEEAENGDFIKIDSTGKPYPNGREYFQKNHRHIDRDLYEQISKPLSAWCAGDDMCPEIEFLIQKRGLEIHPETPDKYFVAPLWGDILCAAQDAVIIFYELNYSEHGNVENASFNFVARDEFMKTYKEL